MTKTSFLANCLEFSNSPNNWFILSYRPFWVNIMVYIWVVIGVILVSFVNSVFGVTITMSLLSSCCVSVMLKHWLSSDSVISAVSFQPYHISALSFLSAKLSSEFASPLLSLYWMLAAQTTASIMHHVFLTNQIIHSTFFIMF